MKIEVHWLIDGVMSVEAETAEQAEKLVAEELTQLVRQTPEFKDKFGANCGNRGIKLRQNNNI